MGSMRGQIKRRGCISKEFFRAVYPLLCQHRFRRQGENCRRHDGKKRSRQPRDYTPDQLAQGVNLADDFQVNQFSQAFWRVDYAVIAKQCYETWQVKEKFHEFDGLEDINAVVKQTEAERAPLVHAIRNNFVPVTHTIQIQPL